MNLNNDSDQNLQSLPYTQSKLKYHHPKAREIEGFKKIRDSIQNNK